MIVIHDFATAREAMRDDDAFAPIDLAGYLRSLASESGRDLATLVHLADNTPFFLDGPRHRMLHLLSSRFLVASQLAAWRPMMEAAADMCLDRLAKTNDPDLVRDFVNPFFRFITGRLLGFDATAADRFDEWIKRARDLLEPMRSLRQISRLEATIREMLEYIAASPSCPSADSPRPLREKFMDELSESFTREDALALVTVLFVASQTTSQTLSNIILHVLRSPVAARASLELETLLRLYASPQFVDRVAKTDKQIGSRRFRRGDHLHMHLPSINRDEGCLKGRIPSAGHLSFGAGAHKCPGATYARMTIGIALPRLLGRYPALSLTVDEPEWENTTFIHAPASLPCQLC